MIKKYKKMHIMFYETATTMSIDLMTMQVENWFYDETMSTNYKTADDCGLVFEDMQGNKYYYLGYVPKFFPNKHYGDYVILNISTDGIVQDFSCTDKDIEACLAKSR